MDRLKELRIDRSDKATQKSSTFLLLGLSALVLLAVAAIWWWLGRTPTVEVRTAPVTSTSNSDGAALSSTVLDASGYVTARLQATVSSKVTGKIIEVLVEEGMAIQQGQLLARLDDATASRQVSLSKAELEAAQKALSETEVQLAEAKINLDRTRRLVESEVSTQANLDGAQAAHDVLLARIASNRVSIQVAKERLALRQQDLLDLEIRAPFTGVAVTKNAQPGEMISPVSAGGGFTRTGVCTLVDMSSLEIEVDVNESYIKRVKADQRVEAVLDAYPNWTIPASVITTVPTADRQKATVRVRIGFDELDPRILPDMGVKVSFLEDRQAAEASSEEIQPKLLIPLAARRSLEERDIVFVVRGETVERRAIRTGSQQGEFLEVEAGLNLGDRVVIEGPEDLTDGAKVSVNE